MNNSSENSNEDMFFSKEDSESIDIKKEDSIESIEENIRCTSEYDENGFTRNSKRSSSNASSLQRIDISESIKKWRVVIENFEGTERKELKSLVHDSVPEKLRPIIWLKMASMKQSSFSSKYKYNKDLLVQYKERWIKSEKISEKDKDKETDNSKQIYLDSIRTFLEHYYFEDENSEGRKRLIRLLTNFCVFRKDMGYCQGMNEIAATILLVCDDDVLAFTIFCEVIEKLEGYFDKGMWELKEDIVLFEWLLQKQFPAVLKHLKENDVETSMYFTKWVLSLFSFVNFNKHIRCIDFVLLEGIKAIYKIGLSIFFLIEEKLLKMQSLDEILPYLLSLHEDDMMFESIYSEIPIEDYLQAAPRFSIKKSFKRQHVRQTSK